MESIRFKGFYYHHTIDLAPSPESFSRHCHNMYEFIYIRQGKGSFIVEGSKYAIQPDCVLLFRPREFHYISIDPDSVYDRYVMHFPEEMVLGSVERLLEPFNRRELGFNNIYFFADPAIAETFSRFSLCRELVDADLELMAKLLLNELLILQHRRFEQEAATDPRSELINQIIGYINENLSTEIRMEELAERFYISKYHLGHLFKENTGLPVLEYVIRKRVLTAQQQIANGKSAYEAAMQCGFNDYSSFYRVYVKYIGEKPSAAQQKQPIKT